MVALSFPAGQSSSELKREVELIGELLSMQILWSKPSYIGSSDVPEEVLEKEKEIAREQMKERLEGKKEAVIEKMIEGKLKKTLEEITLLNQTVIFEPDSNEKVLWFFSCSSSPHWLMAPLCLHSFAFGFNGKCLYFEV